MQNPAFVGVCHCKNRRKFSGSAFAAVVGVPEAAFSVQGKLATYSKTGDTGKAVERRFCPECGLSIVEATATMPGIAMINSGTLDDTSWVKPAVDLLWQCAALGAARRQDAALPEDAELITARHRDCGGR